MMGAGTPSGCLTPSRGWRCSTALVSGCAVVPRGTSVRRQPAGTNLACPTIRTTNDMPISQPASFDALGLVPFQINLHYVDTDPTSTFMGESREERIVEFLEENPCPVLALYEGSWLRVSGATAKVTGRSRLFQRSGVEAFDDGLDISHLLDLTPRFDGGSRPVRAGEG
jgi:dipeptidase E